MTISAPAGLLGFGSRVGIALQHGSVGVMSYQLENTVEMSDPLLGWPLFAGTCWGMKALVNCPAGACLFFHESGFGLELLAQ